jgi:hypothetical protein
MNLETVRLLLERTAVVELVVPDVEPITDGGILWDKPVDIQMPLCILTA